MKHKLMMILFIASEALFFLSLMVAYLYFGQSAHFNTEAKQHLDIHSTALFSIFLFASSGTFFFAERKYRRNHFKGLNFWLLATITLGIVFLIGQAKEYYKLIDKKITIDKNEFTSVFFTLTGFHVLHVLMGLIVLSIILFLSVKGYFKEDKKEVLSAAGLYWHFVDVVWVALFILIYLLPYLL